MTLTRRRLLRLVAFVAALPVLPRMTRAQTYPSRPIRLVVGFPAGGPNDILGRLIAEWLSSRLGQPVEVENQAGSSGNIATASVVRAAPDGPANAISASLPDKLDFVFLRDIAPVAGITREPLVLLVHPSVPANSVAELIAHAKAEPAKVRMASTGAWSSPHVSGELFKMLTGIAVETVHYAGGGPALKELAAGNAQMMFEPMSAAIVPVHSGKLRALAVTTAGHRGPCRGFRRWPRRCRATRQARSRASQCRRTHRTPWSKTSTAPCSLRSAIPASKPGLPRPAASRCQARPPRSPR
jgi:tripartite-type tricarboxylate transporter receptor subunit TctC